MLPTRRHVLLLVAPLLLISACASYELIQPPTRDADLYPFAETKAEVTVAVNEVADPKRVKRHFAADLLNKGILPVQIVVSNHGDDRVVVRPADILLLRGRQVIDPLPVEIVAEIPKARWLIVTEETAKRLDHFYSRVAFKETVLAPGETYQGFLFFEAVPPRPRSSRSFRVVRLFPEPALRVPLAVTALEANERIHFGPFGLYPSTEGELAFYPGLGRLAFRSWQ
jgi:hypothetical protein